MPALSARAQLIWLGLFALMLRIGAAIVFGDTSSGATIWEYGDQALCAFKHSRDLCLTGPDGFVHASAYMPPLPSYLWLVLFYVFGESHARAVYLVVNVLLGAIAVPLLVVLGRKLGFSARASVLAGLLLAAYPTFVFVSSTYHATNLTVALTLMVTLFALRCWREGRIRDAIGCGLLAGLAVATRSEYLLAVPAICLVILILLRRAPQRMAARAALGRAVVAGLAAGLVLTPWVVRNYLVFDRFIPVAHSSGYAAWKSFGPEAHGSGNALESSPTGQAARDAILDSVGPVDEPNNRYENRLQDAYRDVADNAIKSRDIASLVGLTATKAAMTLTFDWTDPLTHQVAFVVPWVVANLLAVIGLILWLRRRLTLASDARWILGVWAAVFAFAYSLAAVHVRYRMHFEPFMFLFAGSAASYLISRLRHRYDRIRAA